jgi:hypothetical protein
MADENQGKTGSANGASDTTQSPTGNQPPATQGAVNADAVAAKNRELLAEIAKLQAKVKKIDDAEAKAAEEKQRAAGQFDSIIAAKDAELKKLTERVKLQQVGLLCRDAGIIDPDYATVIAPQVEFDADGKPTNAETIIASLKTSKPYLFGRPSQVSKPGTSPHSPAAFRGGNPGTFTREQIRNMSPEEYAKNSDAIKRAAVAGQIK